ncbi:MAG: PQQ-binding-like beta-propeller repeat protein [Candidatus Bathyarchaeia archaeon]|jgi:outer membrane protein assembly factor BamB
MRGYDATNACYSNSSAPGIRGAVNWTLKLTTYEGFTNNPVAQNGYIYILYDNNPMYKSNFYLCCLNATNGEIIWNQTAVNPPLYRENLAGISVAVDNGLVYTNSAAYNVTNGELAFNYEMPTNSSPVVSNGIIYTENGVLFALSANSGKLVWNTTFSVRNAPTIANNIVYCDSWDYYLYALKASNGDQIWRIKEPPDPYQQVTVANGHIFAATYNATYCLDALNGKSIWNATTSSQVYGIDTPIVADNIVVAGTCALDAATGALIWNSSTTFISEYPFSSAAADGLLYTYGSISSGKGGLYGLNEALFAFDIHTGEKIWQYTFPAGNGGFDTYQDANPIIANGMVYVGSRTGRLYAFGSSTIPEHVNNQFDYQWILLTVVLLILVVVVTVLITVKRQKNRRK